MTKADIVIYGFDYDTTEKIIDKYTKENDDFCSIYVNDGVHREDRLLCHLRIGADIVCPYIFTGRANALCARTWEDAVRYVEWVREGGSVYIARENDDDTVMKNFMLKQEQLGNIHILHHTESENKSDNSKSENNKSDNNKSDNNKSENNKSDNNKRKNNKSGI